MRRALALAQAGWGRVAPNPLVGAVVVADGEVVGEGYHAEWGEPHAEIVALQEAGTRASGAELYVNLEPCAHTGKTAPCTEAIREAGIRRVVYAVPDPNPAAAGGGKWLGDHGIEVVQGVCADEAAELNEPHLTAFNRERPFVALKYALSLDARLSEAPGVETRVTSPDATRENHRLRAGHDCILVGIGTVLADDPSLTVREWKEPRVAPVRVVLDSTLRLPSGSALARGARDVPLWVFSAPAPAPAPAPGAPTRAADQLRSLGVELLTVPRAVAAEGSEGGEGGERGERGEGGEGGGLDLGAVLDTLRSRDIRSVLCEGGGVLGSALLAQGFVDRMYMFIAPLLFGELGVAAFQGPRGKAPRDWRVIERKNLGEDTLLVLSPGSVK